MFLKLLSVLYVFLKAKNHIMGETYFVETYCKLKCPNFNNSVCIRAPCLRDEIKCDMRVDIKLDNSERQLIIEEHNKYRNIAAHGAAFPKGNPTISKMYVLSYSIELEKSAQCWANACQASKDRCKKTPSYPAVGQNMYVTQSLRLSTTKNFLIRAMSTWFGQVRLFFFFKGKYEINRRTDDFTQMVWPSTRYVGCGRSASPASVFFFCNYAPAGNLEGSILFDGKPPCESCTECNFHYTGLCDRVRALDSDFQIIFEKTQGSSSKNALTFHFFLVYVQYFMYNVLGNIT